MATWRWLPPGGEDCWYAEDLGRSADANAVAPGQVKTLYTEKKATFLTSCYTGGGSRGIEFKLREPGGQWYVPAGSPPDYRIWFNATAAHNFGFNLLDGLGTWVPRKDGHGYVCFHSVTANTTFGRKLNGGLADIYVYNDNAPHTATLLCRP